MWCRRLNVVALRNQGVMTEHLVKILDQDAKRTAQELKKEAEERAEQDREEDQREEIELAKYDQVDLDAVAGGEPRESAKSVAESDSSIRNAWKRAMLLSMTITKQTFGNLEMGNSNRYKQGVSGRVDGTVAQEFGDVKIGSGNEVHQGAY